MVVRMRQIGKFKCLESQMADQDDADLIILFHGYGADAFDLQTMSDVINPKDAKNWLFPQAPLEVPIGPGWTGRAWWNIDMLAIQEAANRGGHRDMTNENPEGLIKFRPQLLEMIEKTKVPWNKIILGGFSQGAMLATDLFLHAPAAPKGLMIFSGQLICKENWKALVANRAGKKFFMCHGTKDPVLSITGAQRLESLLTQNGMKGKLLSFPGVHEIPQLAISAATEYLNSL
jgi:phospholipase/carboxylesterase